MKKLSILSCIALLAPAVMAQTSTSHASGSTLIESIVAILISAVVGLGFLWMVGHMVYVLFIRPKCKTDLTVDMMVEKRRDAGLSDYASDEENQAVFDAIDACVDTWDCFTDSDGEECVLPLTRVAVKTAGQTCVWAEKVVMPTDPEVLERLNNMGEVVNAMRKRTFTASKTMLIVLWIACALLGWGSGNWGGAIGTGLFFSLLYGMASMKPDYVLIRKDLEGKEEKSFLTGIIAGLLGGIAAAPTYRTVTKWSDGSTTTEDDNSATWFSLIFAIIITFVLIILMPVVSLINYLRNYAFH